MNILNKFKNIKVDVMNILSEDDKSFLEELQEDYENIYNNLIKMTEIAKKLEKLKSTLNFNLYDRVCYNIGTYKIIHYSIMSFNNNFNNKVVDYFEKTYNIHLENLKNIKDKPDEHLNNDKLHYKEIVEKIFVLGLNGRNFNEVKIEQLKKELKEREQNGESIFCDYIDTIISNIDYKCITKNFKSYINKKHNEYINQLQNFNEMNVDENISEWLSNNKIYDYVNETEMILNDVQKEIEEYKKIIKNELPNRKLFVITGSISIQERKKFISELELSKNGILLSTQQSLSSSVNINFVNKCIITSSAWNYSTLSQYYFRFIRYNSTEYKDIYIL